MTVRRALLSTYDKTGVAAFAEGLQRLGVELLASGGTARFLIDAGLEVIPLEELTGFAEMLGHRVVTLHPAVHGGILARRDMPEDLADLERHGLEPIDLVCVNLYPFEQTIAGLDVSWEEAIEKIDVGGPAMLRAAAKNNADVVAVCRPVDYEPVLAELRETGEVSETTRRALAARAFSTTAAYDGAVAAWLARDERSTPSVGCARTCSRASSSCTARSSRTTTSTTSRPRVSSPGSLPSGRRASSSSTRIRAVSVSATRSRRPMRRRSTPTRSRPTAAWSSSHAR
jgi:phosphoribosylaminoimidazolecarboxamide formyltransferase/IMP cyclohydrolase